MESSSNHRDNVATGVEELYIPHWFFESLSYRLAWLDVEEGWLYLEIDAKCPNCFRRTSSTWLVLRTEIDLLDTYLRCWYCGYNIGELVRREVETFLAEVDSLLRRVEEERRIYGAPTLRRGS